MNSASVVQQLWLVWIVRGWVTDKSDIARCVNYIIIFREYLIIVT